MFELSNAKGKPKLAKPGGVLGSGWRATTADVGRKLVWSPKGDSVYVGDATGAVYALAGTSGAVLWQANVHDAGVLGLAIEPSRGSALPGHLVSTGEDGRVVFYDANTGQVTATSELGSQWVEHAAWSPVDGTLAVASGKFVHLFTSSGDTIGKLEAHPATVAGLAWSPAGELITACYGQIAIWDPSTRSATTRYPCESPPLCLVTSPDGRILASGSQDSCVYFWRRDDGEKSAMHGYPRKPAHVCFGGGGRWLATSGGETPLVWSFTDGGPEGTEPTLLPVHTLPVTALATAVGRSALATGGRDGGVVVWKIAGEESKIVGFALCEQPIEQLAFRPDDQALAAITRGGQVEVWRCRINQV